MHAYSTRQGLFTRHGLDALKVEYVSFATGLSSDLIFSI